MPTLRHVVPAIALVALVTGVVFLLARDTLVVGLSLVSVLVIAGSLYLMLSPGEHDDGADVVE